jgi:hypothetical protein
MKEPAASAPPAERVTADEARATAEMVLSGHGRVGDLPASVDGAYVFAYHPFPGSERARDLKGALVTVTPLDHDHVRVQVDGVTVSARARVHGRGQQNEPEMKK